MSTIQERIETVLSEHTPNIVYYNAEEGHVGCHGCKWVGASFTGFYAHQAAMLAPVIREERADAWGEGHQAGFQECQNPGPFVNDYWDSKLDNPYRSAT